MEEKKMQYSWKEYRKIKLEWKSNSQGRGRGIVTLVARFHGIYDKNDEGIYDKYEKFRPDCIPMTNMTYQG